MYKTSYSELVLIVVTCETECFVKNVVLLKKNELISNKKNILKIIR